MITTIIIVIYGVAAFFVGRWIEAEQARWEIRQLVDHRDFLNKEVERLTLSQPAKRKRGRPRKNLVDNSRK